MVYGLSGASYDTETLGLYAIKPFSNYDEAAKWLAEEYKKGGIMAGIYNFNQCLIFEQFELAATPA